jgi:hypothetical protein
VDLVHYPKPGYLAGLVKPVGDRDVLAQIRQEYGGNVTVFSAGAFARLTQGWSDEYDEAAGIVHGVRHCGEKVLLFDSRLHGYNAVMNLDEPTDGAFSEKTTDLPAGAEDLLVFQYSGDEFETPEENASAEHPSSPGAQDRFSWIALYILSGGGLALYEDFETS